MRTFTFILLAVFCSFAFSCVNEDYDLSNIDTDGITVGDTYVVPIGTVELKLADLWSKSSVTLDVPDEFYEIYDIGSGIDPDILDMLAENAKKTLEITVTNPLEDISMQLSVSFINSNTDEKTTVVNKTLIDEDGFISIDLTDELIDKVAVSDQIECWVDVLSGAGTTVELTDSDSIDLKIVLRGEGGIKLF